jgi:hypothetical protein
MPETRLVAGNRLTERGEAGRQDFDAFEFDAGFFERAVKLAFYLINCCVGNHKQPHTPYEIKAVVAGWFLFSDN